MYFGDRPSDVDAPGTLQLLPLAPREFNLSKFPKRIENRTDKVHLRFIRLENHRPLCGRHLEQSFSIGLTNALIKL